MTNLRIGAYSSSPHSGPEVFGEQSQRKDSKRKRHCRSEKRIRLPEKLPRG